MSKWVNSKLDSCNYFEHSLQPKTLQTVMQIDNVGKYSIQTVECELFLLPLNCVTHRPIEQKSTVSGPLYFSFYSNAFILFHSLFHLELDSQYHVLKTIFIPFCVANSSLGHFYSLNRREIKHTLIRTDPSEEGKDGDRTIANDFLYGPQPIS